MTEEIVNVQKPIKLAIKINIKKPKLTTQKELPTTWSQKDESSRPYHFVSTCNFNYISDKKLKGIIHEINPNKPYFINNEYGSVDKQEHWHLFFYSSKSINTIRKKLTDLGFLNLKYSDPNKKKYDKYKVSKDIEPCIIYLSKGSTNHMKTIDDENVAPIVRLTNLTLISRLAYRLRYLTILRNMKEKSKDFKENVKEKNESDTRQMLAYMQGKSPEEIIQALPQFFLENLTIAESEFKYTSYFITCLKKYHPEHYKDYRVRQMRKKFEEILLL